MRIDADSLATFVDAALVISLTCCAFGTALAAAACVAVDGDTLVCDRQKIRLASVYAAELEQPGGIDAKRRLQALLTAGEITWVAHGSDRYGRTLADIYVDGRRIEQSDIGPRAGCGSATDVEAHCADRDLVRAHVRHSHARRVHAARAHARHVNCCRMGGARKARVTHLEHTHGRTR